MAMLNNQRVNHNFTWLTNGDSRISRWRFETQPRVAGSSGRLADGVSFQQLERMHAKMAIGQNPGTPSEPLNSW